MGEIKKGKGERPTGDEMNRKPRSKANQKMRRTGLDGKRGRKKRGGKGKVLVKRKEREAEAIDRGVRVGS